MHHPRPVLIAAGTVAVATLGVGGALVALRSAPASSATGGSSPARTSVAPASTTTAPPAPLSVAAASPAAGATGVDGSAPLVVTTSAAVDASGTLPQITPAVAGNWTAAGDRLTFTPTAAFVPLTTYTVTIPAGLRSTAGATVGSARSWTFTTAAGSVLWMQQLLARLGYLPLTWTPAGQGAPASTGAVAPAGAGQVAPPSTGAAAPAGAGQAAPAGAGQPGPGTAYHPPAGQFSWTWSSPPASLTAAWAPGQDNAMTRGAVMAFESDHGLAVDGVAGPQVWNALIEVASQSAPQKNPHGYTYALAQKSSPETLTVWHDGSVISQSPANTGIPQAPTADGTYPVYERLATQIMRGTNPNGTKYADPVAWVAYFNGGDAIHYIARSSYGSPQSLGCVEVSYSVGQHVWPYLTYGSLVTVAG